MFFKHIIHLFKTLIKQNLSDRKDCKAIAFRSECRGKLMEISE